MPGHPRPCSKLRCCSGQLLRVVLVATVLAANPCGAGDALIRAGRRDRLAQSPIALLDVKYVLEHDSALQRRKEEIEAGMALAEATIGQRKQEIRALSRRLANLVAGSAEHTELDLTIIRRTAELNSQIDRARQKFVEENTRAHAEAYQEIVRTVNRYLDETHYGVVLRKSAADARPSAEPRDGPAFYQKKLINRTVVFSQPGVDITHEILRRLNEDQRKTAGRMSRLWRR